MEASHKHIFNILDNLDAFVYVADMETYEVLYVNEYTKKIFGDITGEICWRSIQSDQSSPCEFCTNKYLLNADGLPKDTPYQWEFKNTTNERWYEIRDRAIEWADGRIVRLEIATDITAKKEAEQALSKSELRFRTIADFTYDWELWLDSKQEIEYCSPSCHRITGYTQDDIIATPSLLETTVHPDDLASYEKHKHETHNSSQDSELEYRLIRKDGSIVWIAHQCRAVYFKEDELLGRRVSNRDITKRKHKEQEVIDSEAKIGQLNEHILNMLKIVSHDIRSPLISTASALKLLGYGAYGTLDESAQSTVKDIGIRIKHVLGIADDYLGMAHAISGEIIFDKDNVDLREIIDSILEELTNEIIKKKITIDNRLKAIPTRTIMVTANRTWLGVVYRNLFTNAIKYCNDGGNIAFGYENHETNYILNVFNTGPNIPEDKQNELFAAFKQIRDDQQPVKDGVGMGLYLIKQIINQHGGDIWYQSKTGGNNFIFTLPK